MEKKRILFTRFYFIISGEVKDDVAESGGEVDSEDEEWNYYKGESEVPVPVDCKPNDLVGTRFQWYNYSCQKYGSLLFFYYF